MKTSALILMILFGSSLMSYGQNRPLRTRQKNIKPVPAKPQGDSTDVPLDMPVPKAIMPTEEDYRAKAEEEAKDYIREHDISQPEDRNVFVDKNGVLHLFMYADGTLLLRGYPTTATDKNKFQVHLFLPISNTDTYQFEAAGSYIAKLNIDEDTKGDKQQLISTSAQIKKRDFEEVGPFTDQVVITVKRGAGPNNTIVNQTIKISKTIHASIASGFVYSTLRSPSNIRAVPINSPGGDSTLIADNATGKLTLTLMAVLYPWQRNSLMLQKRSWTDRMGILVGTTIASSTKNFQNLYLGGSYDFAYGGSIVAGVDIAANQQKIRGVNYHDFDFNESKFTGKLANRLYTGVGFGIFFGVQVDSRIFSKLFTASQ